MTRLRAVTVDAVIEAPDAGPRPEMRWLPVASLQIDDSYQREMSGKGHVRRIAQAFTWAHFSPIMVAERPDGVLCIIDGQHRAHAAMMAGQDEVPCLVVRMAAGDEPRAFAAVNGTVQKVTGIALYRAALAAGETWALSVDQFGRACGAEVIRYQPAGEFRRPGTLSCIALIRAEIVQDGGNRLRKVLRVVRASPRAAADVWYWQERFLKAFLEVVTGWPALSVADLAAWVETEEPRRLMADADLLRGKPAYRRKSLPELRRMVVEAAMHRRFGGRAA